MADRLFSTLVGRLAPSVPGCPQPVIASYIRNAAIEVCERTSAWRDIQADITLVAGTYSYSYTPPATTEVHSILTASVNDVPMMSSTIEAVHALYPAFPDSAAEHRGFPKYLIHLDADTFLVAPPPNDTVTYAVRMVTTLKPLRDATGMEKAVFDELEDVIVHAALQHLLVLPDSNWTDRELAAYHAKQYAFKAAERRARTNLGAGRAVLTVRMTPLA